MVVGLPPVAAGGDLLRRRRRGGGRGGGSGSGHLWREERGQLKRRHLPSAAVFYIQGEADKQRRFAAMLRHVWQKRGVEADGFDELLLLLVWQSLFSLSLLQVRRGEDRGQQVR